MGKELDAIVVGAGVGGLAAALRLAGAGASVLVLESAQGAGGKMRVQGQDGLAIDAGPTVLTMRSIFEELWADAGLDFRAQVPTMPLDVLARHRWADQSELDLYADLERSVEAIRAFSDAKQADAFVRFHQKSQEILEAVRDPFMLAPHNGFFRGLSQTGISGLARLSKIQWHRSLWSMLGSYFTDPRLRQLFARYATYYGSDPFQAPGTLALIAGVELDGVWRVQGGMIELANATVRAARSRGARFEFGVAVQEILRDSQGVCAVVSQDGRRWNTRNVVYNGSLAHLSRHICPSYRSRAPRTRSLSAVTLTGLATCTGMELAYHNVYFSSDYQAEFDAIFSRGEIPKMPTTYVCAQDSEKGLGSGTAQRMFALLNAPARGDQPGFQVSSQSALDAMDRVTKQCGIQIEFQPSTLTVTDPMAFETRFPGTGGALYGPATHGAAGAFARPGCQTKIPGLFLVGGQVHPGAGVPMVTLGGRHCADHVIERLDLTRPSRTAVMPGGMSMSSARISSTRSP